VFSQFLYVEAVLSASIMLQLEASARYMVVASRPEPCSNTLPSTGIMIDAFIVNVPEDSLIIPPVLGIRSNAA
jgi:hypothetical protein